MIDWRSHKNPCSLTDPCYVQYKSRLTLSFTKKGYAFRLSLFLFEVTLRFLTFPLIKRSIKAGSFNYKNLDENLMTLPFLFFASRQLRLKAFEGKSKQRPKIIIALRCTQWTEKATLCVQIIWICLAEETAIRSNVTLLFSLLLFHVAFFFFSCALTPMNDNLYVIIIYARHDFWLLSLCKNSQTG